MPTKLSAADLQAALAELEGWSLLNGKLHRAFTFANFVAAFGFMTQVALEANTMNHHPEFYNVWNKVTIDLVTHDVGNAISDLDVALARKINGLLP